MDKFYFKIVLLINEFYYINEIIEVIFKVNSIGDLYFYILNLKWKKVI